nr:hypothetical protein CFP56_63733 [Quercus suber]
MMKARYRTLNTILAVCVQLNGGMVAATPSNAMRPILELALGQIAGFWGSLNMALSVPVCRLNRSRSSDQISFFVYQQPAAMISGTEAVFFYVEGFASIHPSCETSTVTKTFALLNTFMTAFGWRMPDDGQHYGNLLPCEWLYPAAKNVLLWLQHGESNVSFSRYTDARGHFAVEGFVAVHEEPDVGRALSLRRNPTQGSCDSHEATNFSYGKTVEIVLAGTSSQGEVERQWLEVVVVPFFGLTIISDIDDVLRPTEIWDPYAMLQLTFLSSLQPWLNMPSIFKSWCRATPHIHFHYVSDTPDRAAGRIDMDGIAKYYPRGSFDFRPWSFHDLLKSPRYSNLKQTLTMFPNRSFILIGDTSTGSTLSAYARLEKEHPQQVQCILIRDISRTEPANWIVADLAQMPRSKTVLFSTPDDLKGARNHIRALAEGTATGCGPFRTSDTFPAHSMGFFRSWFHTLDLLQKHVLECMLFGEFRPVSLCLFDRRRDTVFLDGGREPRHNGR